MADPEKAPLLPLLSSQSPQDNTEHTENSALNHLREEVTRTRAAHLEASKQYASAWRHTRSGRAITIVHNIILTIVGMISVLVIGSMLFALSYAIIYGDDDLAFTYPRRVPLEAHIMSKCPDARDCLRDLVLPAMQRVNHQVDFKLSYIGKTTDHDDGVECMHGPEECLGNILELCAAEIYPDPKIYLGFTMCMTRQYKDIPQKALVQDCALEHGISFEKLNECASDEHTGKGISLLRESVERSASENVTTSCTVRVDGEKWCVRDGGQWKDCDGGSGVGDLVKHIHSLRETQKST